MNKDHRTYNYHASVGLNEYNNNLFTKEEVIELFDLNQTNTSRPMCKRLIELKLKDYYFFRNDSYVLYHDELFSIILNTWLAPTVDMELNNPIYSNINSLTLSI